MLDSDRDAILDSQGPSAWPRWLWQWSLALVLIGATWRTVRLLLQFPVWGDEAFVAVNFLDRSYTELIEPLRFGQVAPLFFLWGELTIYRLLGRTEIAMRLLPYLAGLLALLLFWRLSYQALPPRAASLALGIFAVSYYPVRHSIEIKPYALDLLMSVALLTLAVGAIRQPRRLLWPTLLTALAPVALGFSYPLILVAGAVSLALAPIAWTHPDRAWQRLYLLYNALTAIAFVGFYWLVGAGQFQSAGGTLNKHWISWFSPSDTWGFVYWVFQAHLGNMFAYPVGGRDGGSIVTFVLCLLGAWQLSKTGQFRILHLCLLPFALGLVAAFLHRYPYGGSARIAQHLAPAICLLAGAGGAALISGTLKSQRSRWRSTVVAFSLLALIGIGGIARDLWKPYKTAADQQVRAIVTEITRNIQPDDRILVFSPHSCLAPGFEWYLRTLRFRVSWNGLGDPRPLGNQTENVWALSCDQNRFRQHDIATLLAQSARRFVLARHSTYALQFGWADGPTEIYHLFHWKSVPD